ncbi:MAG TPA: NUDIX domain-containing protein [Candidatus Angelobacter sp.]|nr:NUDIX domain-containing protein [Candidatus Angelobacter sp.]
MATQIATSELPVIRAAGGILLRDSPGGDEVMIVFRARHQDWTLPKGKLRQGETFQEAALREVEEETGCRCDLGNYLGMISYSHAGVPKVVMFWRMNVVEEKPRPDGEEITEALWLPVPAAIQCLTYAQEKSLLTRMGPARPPQKATDAETEPAVETVPDTLSPPPGLDSPRAAPAMEVVENIPLTPAEIVAASAPGDPAPDPASQTVAIPAEPVIPEPPVPVVSSSPVSVEEPHPASRRVAIPSDPAIPEPSVPVVASSPVSVEEPRAPVAAKVVVEPAPDIEPEPPKVSRRRRSLEHELHAFRVELSFLTQRAGNTSDFWAAAAQQHLGNASKYLAKNDLEGGQVAMSAARRFAVMGFTQPELAARAQVLRDEALRMFTWRGTAIQRLLATADDTLTAPRVSDAMLLRDENEAEQLQRRRTATMRLRLVLAICLAGAVALLLCSFTTLFAPYSAYALLAFAGLLGSALAAAQLIVYGRDTGRVPGWMLLPALVLVAAVAGLPADSIYQYVAQYIKLSPSYDPAIYPLALFLGYIAQRLLLRFAGYGRESPPIRR